MTKKFIVMQKKCGRIYCYLGDAEENFQMRETWHIWYP